MYKLVDDLRKFCGLDWFLVLPCGCCCCGWLYGVKLEPPGWSILRGGASKIFVKIWRKFSINNVYIMLLVDLEHPEG